jgi:hypothetical protein
LSWSEEQPIAIRGFGGASSPDELLRLRLLDASDDVILFESTDFTYDDGSVFVATLNCSVVPYDQVVPDAAMPVSPPALAFLGACLLTTALLVAAASFQPRRVKRRHREEGEG